MKQFSSWYPLTDDGVEEHAPEGPAALQIKRADGLVDYAEGKSAMLCYLYGAPADRALRERFEKELADPGGLGEGPLLFRFLEDDDAKETLADLLFKFVQNFGEPPRLNRHPD